MSFEILRKSSCWWALKFVNSDTWGLRKRGLKLVTLCLKAWPNHPFLRPSLPCAYWNLKHPVPWEKHCHVICNSWNENTLKPFYNVILGKWFLDERNLGMRKGWFGHAFRHRVTNFKPHFLSPWLSELKNFSAHQQEDFLRISKLTLLLFLVQYGEFAISSLPQNFFKKCIRGHRKFFNWFLLRHVK